MTLAATLPQGLEISDLVSLSAMFPGARLIDVFMFYSEPLSSGNFEPGVCVSWVLHSILMRLDIKMVVMVVPSLFTISRSDANQICMSSLHVRVRGTITPKYVTLIREQQS